MVLAQELLANYVSGTAIADESELKKHFDQMTADLKKLFDGRKRNSHINEIGFIALSKLMADKKIEQHLHLGEEKYRQFNGFIKDCKRNLDVHDTIRREIENTAKGEGGEKKKRVDFMWVQIPLILI